MNLEDFISLNQLSTYYKVEVSFFTNLNEIGLIEIKTIEESDYVLQDQINEIEKMIRMHRDLEMNIEGIEVALNLLKRIDALQKELETAKSRLQLYEKDEDYFTKK